MTGIYFYFTQPSRIGVESGGGKGVSKLTKLSELKELAAGAFVEKGVRWGGMSVELSSCETKSP